jgi:hypothetical protein
MNESLVLDIVTRINEVAGKDGVRAVVNYTTGMFRSMPNSMTIWDVEIEYKGYHLVERFNNSMNITDSDVDLVAKNLLVDLFREYFSAKIRYK